MKTIIYLILIIVSVSIFGADTINIREERRVDTEPTKEEIEEYLKNQKEIDSHVNENDIQDKELLKKEDNGSKSQSDFNYLEGYNLSNATFQNSTDEQNYGSDINNNYFIPQGLSKDKYGNLLISMYHGITCWYDATEICSYRNSIIVRYDPEDKVILNIYSLPNSIGDHVGGVAYHDVLGFSPWGYYTIEYILVSYNVGNSGRIKIYKVTGNDLVLEKIEKIPHKNSVMSSSNGYLWIAKNVLEYDINEQNLTGYKIDYLYDSNYGWQIILGENYQINIVDNTNTNELIPNYDLLQPKPDLQGVYCDSDPEVEDRLKFYFSASDNITYVYQATLATRDLDSNGLIDNSNEYYWESDYTPYGYNSGSYRKLPDGGEGIVMKDDKLWMLNEGATQYYCFWWWDDDIDCAREILVIDPVYPYEDPYEVFPSGSIKITGSGLENYGSKVAIVLAQNKFGKLYYSIGEFSCTTGSCKIFLKEPLVNNPTGKQFPYYEEPSVWVEDIIGIYFMNLNQYGSGTNSDDFYMDTITFRFDDNYYLGDGDPYYASKLVWKDFGDNDTNLASGDKEAMLFSFQSKYGTYRNMDPGNTYYENEVYINEPMYRDVFIPLRNCYSSYGGTSGGRSQCRSEALYDMEDYINDNTTQFLMHLNANIDRLYDITL